MGSQPESRLSRSIMNALRARGAFVWKNHGGPTMMAGLPDIAGCYRGVFIAIETKTPSGGAPSPTQAHRMTQIAEAGGWVRVVRSVAEATAWLDRIDTAMDRGAPVPRTTPKMAQHVSEAVGWPMDDDMPNPDNYPFDYAYDE